MPARPIQNIHGGVLIGCKTEQRLPKLFFLAGLVSEMRGESNKRFHPKFRLALISYLFGSIPGIKIISRNTVDIFKSDEIDIGCRNDRHPDGLVDPTFPFCFLIEGKNWKEKVGSKDVVVFEEKLAERCMTFGILVATNGITGDPEDLTSAHHKVARALSNNRRIILLKRKDIENLSDSAELVELIKQKLCELSVYKASFS